MTKVAGRLGPIGQIALHVSDADRAEHFYRDIVGLPMLFRVGDLLFFDCGGVRLMLEGGHPPRSGEHAAFCIYLLTQAIDSAAAALTDAGVQFDKAPHRIATMPDHELWMAFFRDPDANLLALMEERRA